MGMSLTSLDNETRKFMLDELEQDVASNKLYISPRLNDAGRRNYEKLLRSAMQNGDDVSLANSLAGLFKEYEQRAKPSGGYTTAKVPINAPETLAEGEFNRFYCRGVCRRAIEQSLDEVEVYRAKAVQNPRPQSQVLVGSKLKADKLLHDLRINIGVDTALGVPAGPNSGLSIRLP
ncbi:MAG: hypothetical protein MUP49_01895 [Dehalococcoidia bacterium]|nr:hypothetical protein [Dehalococcoidia bacterium]